MVAWLAPVPGLYQSMSLSNDLIQANIILSWTNWYKISCIQHKMSKVKIFNDPMYGLVSYPFEVLYELIDHPYFQRLRRIAQLGLSNMVYPGAVHSRFNHALGVVHLCTCLVQSLRQKDVQISDEEYEACCIASLLHDIGHGPFSHTLEYEIVPFHHEDLTLFFMEQLNHQFGGRLRLAIEIFKGTYHRPFLHQLLSSQLDIDRMDYLNRDSFYTGVAEGVIGYERIIKMMNVVQGQLVVEQKGLYSIEKFLVSRFLMYQQVYLHKTAISSEQMLLAFFRRYKELKTSGQDDFGHPPIDRILRVSPEAMDDDLLDLYASLDDSDIIQMCKLGLNSQDFILRYLGNGLLNRRLFKTFIKKEPFNSDFISTLRHKTVRLFNVDKDLAEKIVVFGSEQSVFYHIEDEIKIKTKDREEMVDYSKLAIIGNQKIKDEIHYVTFPKEI